MRLQGLGDGRSKLRGAQCGRLKLMPQLQAQVPNPLADHLPGVLPTRSVRAPAIGILFLVFIRKRGLKGPTMQIQLDDIASSERLLRQRGEEEFVDDPARVTPTRLFVLPVGEVA